MYPALNAWTLPDGLSPQQQLVAAAEAGFAGIELVVSEAGPLRPDTPPEVFRALADQAEAMGLRIAGLACGLFWKMHYASPRPEQRERACDLTLRLLERASAARAGAVLVVPGVVGRWDEPVPQVRYEDALHAVYEALVRLRWEAEAWGVVLALENVWNRFLLSPMEWAELIDRVNSPAVGVYLDVGNVLAHGYPQDWITLLGRRIMRVHVKDYDLRRPGPEGFCPLGQGHVDWSAVIGALRSVGYDGPLTWEGPGSPAEAARFLARWLAEGAASVEVT